MEWKDPSPVNNIIEIKLRKISGFIPENNFKEIIGETTENKYKEDLEKTRKNICGLHS